jgi:hypothetical protein
MRLPLLLSSMLALSSVVGCAGSAETAESTEAAVTGDPDTSPVTVENFRDHPSIVAIRAIVQATDRDIAAKMLVARTRTELCGPESLGDSTRETHSIGTAARRYIETSASGDSAQRLSIDYDARGTPRFVFRAQNDVLGHRSETRVYFDEAGSKLIAVVRNGPAEAIESAPFEAGGDDAVPAGIHSPHELFNAAPDCL